MNITSNKRIDYISLASVLSAIAVIYMHTSTFWTFERNILWFYSDIIESVFYFAVPVFFMITGALLIDFDKKYDLTTYFKKRIRKTVIPYIIWSIIMAITLSYAHHTPFNIINSIFSGISIYWFFIPLFCIYLCIPLFSSINDEKKAFIFKYIVAIGFIINILLPFIISVFNLKIEYSLNIAITGNFLIYPLIGYLIHNGEVGKKRIYFYLLALIGLLLHIFGTYYLSMYTGSIVQTYKGLENLPCFLYAIGIFIFIKYDLNKIMDYAKINRIINYLSTYTFGVYLVHIFIIEFMAMLLPLNTKTVHYMLISPIVYFLISAGIIYIMRKIPLLREIVP